MAQTSAVYDRPKSEGKTAQRNAGQGRRRQDRAEEGNTWQKQAQTLDQASLGGSATLAEQDMPNDKLKSQLQLLLVQHVGG